MLRSIIELFPFLKTQKIPPLADKKPSDIITEENRAQILCDICKRSYSRYERDSCVMRKKQYKKRGDTDNEHN